jgi:hypothetical protein
MSLLIFHIDGFARRLFYKLYFLNGRFSGEMKLHRTPKSIYVCNVLEYKTCVKVSR